MSMKSAGLAAIALALCAAPTMAEDWPSWRGPSNQGVSTETDLVNDWSPDGKNLVWKAPWIGRSTPIVIDGRVCTNGRVGEGITRQEAVACWDAETGKQLWEHRFNVYNTTVPFNRVGWASVVADPETGNLYVHGVAGQLIAYDPAGKIVWQRFLTEDYGHMSGYGGRTQTPLVDGEQVLISFVSSGWGPQAAPKNRYWSFDKKTGDLLWVSTPGGIMQDANTQGCPVVADVAGRRMLIAGDADGWIYAMDVATGEKIWGFRLSQRAINSTVLVANDTVYAGHSEENIDEATMGRVVAIDATGKGDVTATHEKWRLNELTSGFPSPAYRDGTLWVIDNSANMYQIDAGTGAVQWKFGVGTVGKASPVWADGKLYVTETNGRVQILKPGASGVEVLSNHEVRTPEGDRYAEIYGSPAISGGRVYIATEGWLYCIGAKERRAAPPAAGRAAVASSPRAPKDAATHWVQVRPAEVLLEPGGSQRFTVVGFDEKGRAQGALSGATFQLERLRGTVDDKGVFKPDAAAGPQAGAVTVKVGDKTGTARVRVVPGLPWSEDYESYAPGSVPPHWFGSTVLWEVTDLDGSKVLAKKFRENGLLRNGTFTGPWTLSNYTIEADLKGAAQKRRKADIGLINSGYTMELMGNHQRLQVRSWTSENRMMQQVDFPWEMDVWYRMKLRVETAGGKARILGKVWKRGESEPADWSITVDDPLAIESGAPGITGYSPADIYFDNLKVMVNQ